MYTKRGQSLIELLVAMTVIIVGLTAAGSLVFSNIQLQEVSADRVVAANLAREGVELVKAWRDSNWLAGNVFNDGLSDVDDYTGVPIWVSGQHAGFDFTADAIADTDWTMIKRSTQSTNIGLFAQGATHPGTDTEFRRLLTLHPVCEDGSVISDGVTCGALRVIGIQVESLVTWSKRGVTRQSLIVDEIYDWR